MSGGKWDFKDEYLKDEIFGYSWNDDNKWNGYDALKDRELSEMLFDMLTLLHDYDWFASGDTGESDWIEAKMKFKNKWLGSPEVRVRRVINQAVEELKGELYNIYGLNIDN